ncbi:MAG: hypothetical protein OHK0029_05360 [Armatimonadaceae bacterium]
MNPAPLPPVVAMALVAAVLGALLLGLRSLRGRVHPEIVRKLLHVGMGLVTLSFPWLFSASWPVWVLAAGASLLLLLLKRGNRAGGAAGNALRAQLGGVVDGVQRESLGEIYFPLAVAVLFFLTRGNPVAFIVPMLLLTLSDAVAALIGVRYGALRYTTDEGQKSWEGSIAFFVTAFLSVHIPLLLFTDIGRAECLYIALILGLLVMLLEAVAWAGLDNLLVPLGGYMLLRSFWDLDAPSLGIRLAITLGLVIFALWWRSRTTLNHGAVLGAVVFGFVAWSVGGWLWLLPPVTLFALYAVLFPRTNPDGEVEAHTAQHVLLTISIGMFWLFVSAVGNRPDYLLPYTVSFGGHLTVIGALRHGVRCENPRTWHTLASVVLLSAGVMFLPMMVHQWTTPAPLFPAPQFWAFLLVGALGMPLGIIAVCTGTEREEIIWRGGSVRRIFLLQGGILIGSLLPLLALNLWGRTLP